MNVVHDSWPRTSLFRHRAGNEVNEHVTSSLRARSLAVSPDVVARIISLPDNIEPDAK